MAQNSQVNPNDRRLKRINSDARHKANQRGKKEQEELEKDEKQMRL